MYGLIHSWLTDLNLSPTVQLIVPIRVEEPVLFRNDSRAFSWYLMYPFLVFFMQNIGKLAEGISDNTNEVNDVENNAGLLRAGQFEVNVKPAGGQPQQDAYVETKHGYNDNIELINRDVKGN